MLRSCKSWLTINSCCLHGKELVVWKNAAASLLYWDWLPFQENEEPPKEDRSISLFPSIEEWGRMMMKHFSMTPELNTNFFSLTPHPHPTFLLMHCELTDQVSRLSVRWSFLYTYPQEKRKRVHYTVWMPW